jgi:hypothetical protein
MEPGAAARQAALLLRDAALIFYQRRSGNAAPMPLAAYAACLTDAAVNALRRPAPPTQNRISCARSQQ